MTGFGVVLVVALVGAVFAFAPAFLGLASASVDSDALVSFALALLLVAFLGFITEISEVGGAFHHEGWENLGITAILALLPAVPLALAFALEPPGWVEFVIRSAALLLCLPLALGVAATLDAFFIKPRLRPPPSRAERRAGQGTGATSGTAGSVAALIAWALANLANLLTVVDRLFSSG